MKDSFIEEGLVVKGKWLSGFLVGVLALSSFTPVVGAERSPIADANQLHRISMNQLLRSVLVGKQY